MLRFLYWHHPSASIWGNRKFMKFLLACLIHPQPLHEYFYIKKIIIIITLKSRWREQKEVSERCEGEGGGKWLIKAWKFHRERGFLYIDTVAWCWWWYGASVILSWLFILTSQQSSPSHSLTPWSKNVRFFLFIAKA